MRCGEFEGPSAEWDGFVRGRDGWTPFHLYGWKRLIENLFGHDCPYLAARDAEGRVAGILPLVRVQSPLFGHYLVSMPFLNYGGPLGEREAVVAMCAAAAERAESDGADLLELRSRRPLDVALDVSHRKVTVVLALPKRSEALWEGLPSKVRSQVRRPRKEGVEVRFGGDQRAPFYRVFSRHMRDLGTPALPAAWFERIHGTFADDVWFGCAWLGDEPIAAGAGFRWAGEFELTWASALREHSRIAANMLLYWSFMERAIQEGLSTFNFGRCTPGSGTHRFKAQWGGTDEKLWWYRHSSDGTEATPSPDDERWAWGPRVWQKLPLRLANALGPRIVKYVP